MHETPEPEPVGILPSTPKVSTMIDDRIICEYKLLLNSNYPHDTEKVFQISVDPDGDILCMITFTGKMYIINGYYGSGVVEEINIKGEKIIQILSYRLYSNKT